MGFLKQMKDMKKTVEAAPGMISQAQALGAQAQQMGAAQQAAMGQQYGAMGAMGGGITANPNVPGGMDFGGIGANAQAQADAQRATAAAGAAAVGVDTTKGTAPIEGVTLEQFAAIAKGLAAYNYDQTKAPLVAQQHGITAEAYEVAAAGWNGRITADPAVAQAFNAAYRAI